MTGFIGNRITPGGVGRHHPAGGRRARAAGVTLFGAYGEAHPRQISDRLPAGSAAAHTPDAALILVAVASLVLAVRHRWPRVVLAVSAGAGGGVSALRARDRGAG